MRPPAMIGIALACSVLTFVGSALYAHSLLHERESSVVTVAREGGEVVPESSSPTLSGHALGGLDDRLLALQEQVAELQRTVAPVIETHSKLMSGELLGEPGVGAGQGREPSEGAETLQDVARALNLKGQRRTALEDRFAQLVVGIEQAEAGRHEVENADGKLTIRIGAFEQDAARLRQDWQGWLERNLTTEEWETYQQEHFDAQLLGARLSGRARRIELTEEGGSLQFREIVIEPDGAERTALQATAPAAARDFLLRPYRHLLDEK